MTSGLSLQILTPAGQLMDTQIIHKVGLPTALGDIEILPGHARFAGILGTGILRATKADGTVEKMVVSGGFVNLSDGLVRVMTDFADFSDSPNLALLRSQKGGFEKILQTGDPNQSGFQAAKDKLARLGALETLQAQA